MDIRINTRRTKKGTILATARILTAEDVKWFRVTLPESVSLDKVQHDLVNQVLAHLKKHGGPAANLVMYQLALPSGG